MYKKWFVASEVHKFDIAILKVADVLNQVSSGGVIICEWVRESAEVTITVKGLIEFRMVRRALGIGPSGLEMAEIANSE